ncbi:MAG: LysR family transcriptional regulator [Erysipelotrichaceae bacterium]|nr:LysR family transcriptional regulator [Erysipelotrichaceae bacterium]
MITIKHLTIFMEVARTQSMSRAAENLYMSQPTVSQKIKEIEDYYHISLFQRYSKSLGISAEGKLFLKHAEKILYDINQLNEEFLQKKANINLRVGTTLTIGNTLAPLIARKLETEYPDTKLTMCIENTESLERKLLDNSIDIAIVEGEIHNDLIVRQGIIPDRMVFVCSPGHPLARKRNVTLQDLCYQNFIFREKGSGTRANLEYFLSHNRIPYVIKWECSSWETIKQAVIANQGITLISIRLVEQDVYDKNLVILPIQENTLNRNFTLCYRQNKELTLDMEHFIHIAKSVHRCPLLIELEKKEHK